MRTVHRSLAIVVAALLMLASGAAAQENSSAILKLSRCDSLSREVSRRIMHDSALTTLHSQISTRLKRDDIPSCHRASSVTEKVLAEFAAKASTPAEHHSLEQYFVMLARVYAAAAKEHALFAVALRGPRIEHAAAIHNRMAALSTNAEKEAYEAAQMHKGLAGEDR